VEKSFPFPLHGVYNFILLKMPGKPSSRLSSFTFRQRAGRLDWRRVSSIDVEDVVLNLKVEELQVLLDTVTFSEFDALEVKSNTIEHITKLVNLMQLIIEYLLHHQEHQFHLVRKQTKKIEHLIDKNDTYQRRLETFKEDVRTYQRQLHILRKSIQAGGGGINTELLFRLVQKDPKINDPSALSTNNNTATGEPMNMELVKMMLDHEHEARATMQQMLEEQRRLFQSELNNLHETIRRIQSEHEMQLASQDQQSASNKDAWNTATISLLLENMKAQMENTARQMMDSMKENMKPASNHSEIANSKQNNNNVEDILRQSAMETYARELSDRESALMAKESDLKRREAVLQKSLSLGSSNESSSSHDSNIFRRKCALQLMFATIRRINQRRLLRRFRRWMNVIFELQRDELLDEHAKQLLFANEKRTNKDGIAHQTLLEEQQKNVVLQARYNALQRELEALQESTKLNSLKADQADRTEEVLQEKLRKEKEKSVIVQAKYNALQQRMEKEKEEIQARLAMAEEIIAQQAEKLSNVVSQWKEQQGKGRLPNNEPPKKDIDNDFGFLSPVRPVSSGTSSSDHSSQTTQQPKKSQKRQDTRLAALKAADELLARQRATLFAELDYTPVVGASRENMFLRNVEERALAKADVDVSFYEIYFQPD
jgi:hypothetical protein